jgi:hypothetical protein
LVQLNSPAQILKLLDGSNCGKCKLPTCSAFASSVFVGKRRLGECPNLKSEVVGRYEITDTGHNSIRQQMDEALAKLQQAVVSIDLSDAAQRLGAHYSDGKLTTQCLGKNFSVDLQGNIETDIHVNPWLAIPMLNYILEGKGIALSGEWTMFRDLKNGRIRYPLFVRRCETPLKKVAGTYTNLFEDMLQIFDGKKIDFHYPSDISVVLYPLPIMPVLICYSGPEDGLESDLKIFFDKTAEGNLDIESIYKLVAGMVMMFEKLALRHGI